MAVAMARPKKKPVEPGSVRQPTALTIRGSKEWRDWLERGARYCRTDSSKLVDIAVAHYLRAQGFDEPAPER
jgi:predicted transcriptional regulator